MFFGDNSNDQEITDPNIEYVEREFDPGDDRKCFKKVRYARNTGKKIMTSEISKDDLSEDETLLLQI